MNTSNWSKNTGSFGNTLFRLRGLTPYPIVLLFALFAEPTLLSFAGGLPLMIVGEALRLWSVAYAGPDTRRPEIVTHQLVTGGPYARMRHPIYLGNLLLYLGTAIVANFWLPHLLLAVGAFFGLQYFLIARAEERALRVAFGDRYRHYRKNVPGYWPTLRAYPLQTPPRPAWQSAFKSEKSTFLSILAILIMFVLRMLL